MNEEEKNQLDELLDRLYEEKCPKKKNTFSSCSNCPFYVESFYEGICTIENVQNNK